MRMKVIIVFGVLAVGLVMADSSEYAKPGSRGPKSTTCLCGTRKRPISRIVGGDKAGAGEWPMMVGIQEFLPKGVLNCGGTIITKKHVVTAAHCLVHPNLKIGKIELADPSKMRIIYGINDKSGVPADNRREVDMYHVHEKYKIRGLSNDIAVVVIKETFPLYQNPNVLPACLPVAKHPVPLGSDAIAVGWGLTSWTSPKEFTKTHILKQVHVKTEDLEKCNSIYPDHPNRFNTTFRHQICTFSPGKSTCKGDSGGPLFWYDSNLDRYLLVGVTSFGPYAKNGNPGCTGIAGFTDISVYTDWIQDKVEYENESYCKES